MAALVALCPATGRFIETGIETDQASLARTPRFSGQIACPHCNTNHDFSKDSILVCELVDGVVHYQRAA